MHDIMLLVTLPFLIFQLYLPSSYYANQKVSLGSTEPFVFAGEIDILPRLQAGEDVKYVDHLRLDLLHARRFDGMHWSTNSAYSNDFLTNPSWDTRRMMAFDGNGALFTNKSDITSTHRTMPFGRDDRVEARRAWARLEAEKFTSF